MPRSTLFPSLAFPSRSTPHPSTYLGASALPSGAHFSSEGDTSLSGISSSPLRLQAGAPGIAVSVAPEPRRQGPDQGAGSGCVVTAPAWPRGRCPRRPWRTPHPRHGPGPAPGRRAFAARGGVCCFCSQPERERDGCWRRNSGLTSDCCCLGFCFFFWGTLTSFSSRALLC